MSTAEQSTVTSEQQQQIEQDLFNKLSAVETALNERNPALQMHMVRLHAHCKKQPELVHLLTDEQIATMVGAYVRLTNSNITTLTTASKSKGKSTKAFSAGDLGLDLG